MYAAASVSHSIFLDSSGAVFTCGKGRGLLGHGDSKIKTVPTRVQSLEVINFLASSSYSQLYSVFKALRFVFAIP